jgi:hypothetical protein
MNGLPENSRPVAPSANPADGMELVDVLSRAGYPMTLFQEAAAKQLAAKLDRSMLDLSVEEFVEKYMGKDFQRVIGQDMDDYIAKRFNNPNVASTE